MLALGIRFVDCVTPEVEFRLPPPRPITFLCQFDTLSEAERRGGKTVGVLNPTGILQDFKPQSQVVQFGQHTDELVKRNLGLKEKAAIWVG